MIDPNRSLQVFASANRVRMNLIDRNVFNRFLPCSYSLTWIIEAQILERRSQRKNNLFFLIFDHRRSQWYGRSHKVSKAIVKTILRILDIQCAVWSMNALHTSWSRFENIVEIWRTSSTMQCGICSVRCLCLLTLILNAGAYIICGDW
jgi:hypothetical protein